MERFRVRSDIAQGIVVIRNGWFRMHGEPCAFLSLLGRKKKVSYLRVTCSFISLFAFILQFLINLTYVRFAFPLFQGQISPCKKRIKFEIRFLNLHLQVMPALPRWDLWCLLRRVNYSFLLRVSVFCASVTKIPFRNKQVRLILIYYNLYSQFLSREIWTLKSCLAERNIT